VTFYRESNGTSGLQTGAGGDTLIGTDIDPAEGWSLAVSTVGLALGTYTYYAHAVDDEGALSGIVSAKNTVSLFQIASDIAYTTSATAGQTISLPVRYTTSSGDSSLSRFGLRMHYNSSLLEFVDFTDLFRMGLVYQATDPDSTNADGDPTTDTYVMLVWSDGEGGWPSTELPTQLFKANFKLAADAVDGTETVVRFSGQTTANGYNFQSNPITVHVSNYTLDADGNGTADALTDGILILRYLFSPPGNWNIDDALDPAATRTTLDALRSYLNNARPDVLDVDGNGTADALTDGILILRYLFSPSGEWESSDAVGVGAARTSRASIQAFLDLYNPNVAAASAAGLIIAPSISSPSSEGLSSSPGNEREDRRSDGSAILCLSPDRVVRSTATDAALEADLSVLDSPPAEFAIQATGLWFKEQAEGAEQYLAPPNAASRVPAAFEQRALDAIHQQSTMSSAASHLETVRPAAWARGWHSDSADEDLFDVDLAGDNSWWSNRNQRGQVPGRSVRHTVS
jgi:hypothetical protein